MPYLIPHRISSYLNTPLINGLYGKIISAQPLSSSHWNEQDLILRPYSVHVHAQEEEEQGGMADLITTHAWGSCWVVGRYGPFITLWVGQADLDFLSEVAGEKDWHDSNLVHFYPAHI